MAALGAGLNSVRMKSKVSVARHGRGLSEHDTRLDHKVALKVLSPGSTTESEHPPRFARKRELALSQPIPILSSSDVGS